VPVRIPKDLPDRLYTALVVLNLKWPATAETLRTAYRRKVLQHHPDRGGSCEAFAELSEAKAHVEEVLAHGLAPPEPEPEPEPDPAAVRRLRFRMFKAGFFRNRNGNLVRREGTTFLTVFANRGRHHWCVNQGGRPRFSQGQDWPTEEDALFHLWQTWE
jgi:hypothetical protein